MTFKIIQHINTIKKTALSVQKLLSILLVIHQPMFTVDNSLVFKS